MNIVFYGQTAFLPRIDALARQLVQDWHEVTVFGAAPHVASRNYHGVRLKTIPSLNPQKPGGWLYLVLGLLYLLFKQPNVIHVHSWQAALLLSLTRWFFPHTRIIWTIDELPSHYGLRVTNYGLRNAILTTPSRALQYRLLTYYGIRTIYIPDGYHESVSPDINLKHFGLKKGQYCLALGNSPAALRRIKKAYAGAKTRKKLIVNTSYQLPDTSYQSTPRVRRSIISHAAVVVIGDESVSTETLLEAMDAKRAIIAPTQPGYQEVLGTTGQYYARRDTAGLIQAITGVVTNTKAQQKWGAAANLRATHHFTWPRIVEEYSVLYAPQVRLVPVDSLYCEYSPKPI